MKRSTNPLSLPRLIGMVHLAPLPGSPRFDGERKALRERALRDAELYQRCGFDAILVENYGDLPFHKESVPPYTVAEMSALCCALRHAVDLPLGVQVLRNDAAAALSVAAASGASFVRVNVHCGSMHTDQGLIEGRAHETLRLRRALDAEHIAIFADVFVKHATPPPGVRFEHALRDTVERGLADAVIVSGSGTGEEVDGDRLRLASEHSPRPVYVGSGARISQLAELLRYSHGVIVGTAVKQEGRTSAPVDEQRCRDFATAFREA